MLKRGREIPGFLTKRTQFLAAQRLTHVGRWSHASGTLKRWRPDKLTARRNQNRGDRLNNFAERTQFGGRWLSLHQRIDFAVTGIEAATITSAVKFHRSARSRAHHSFSIGKSRCVRLDCRDRTSISRAGSHALRRAGDAAGFASRRADRP
jgi:hypothetical protein